MSAGLAGTTRRTEKTALIAELLADAEPDEIAPAIAFLTGTTTGGRIGIGWAALADVRPDPAATPSLTIADVDAELGAIGAVAGAGSTSERRDRLGALLAAATEPEQRLIRGVIAGEVRQGALEGVALAGVAKAAGVTVDDVRRAAMFAGSLGTAAAAALTGGATALAAIGLTPGRAVQPMLASTAPGVDEAMAGSAAPVSVEWKLDGVRVQAHRAGGTVTVFTRNLNDVTSRLPGVVDVVAAMPGGDLVLDGEAIGLGSDGRPRRFQDTMGDFGAFEGRGGDLVPVFFDVLFAGRSMVDERWSTRRAVLDEIVPEAWRIPSTVTDDPAVAAEVLAVSLARGHEGVMVKSVGSRYEAGRRGGSWRKVKPVHTLDLVVLAVEWGSGRRRGWLSNIHLGARDPDGGSAPGGFVMVGKTFKGMTDEMLRWQTERFLALETHRGTGRDGHVVHVRPEQVVEIALDGVQRSTRYPGGVALRFARVRRYRDDKTPEAADTIDTVRALLR